MEKSFNLNTKEVFKKIIEIETATGFDEKDDIYKGYLKKLKSLCQKCEENETKAVLDEEDIEEIMDKLGMKYKDVVLNLPWYEPYEVSKREIIIAILDEVTEINHNLKVLKTE